MRVMGLFKTSILSVLSTFIKILSVFIINKFVSVYIGPAGLGTIGQFQNFSQVMMAISKGGINNGVVKYIASSSEVNEEKEIIKTSIVITIVLSLTVGIFLFLFSEFISYYLFSIDGYENIIKVFGFTIILFSLNQLLLSILNGKRKITEFMKINITQSLYGLFFTSLFVIFFGLKGALYAIATNQSIVFIFTTYNFYKKGFFNLEVLNSNFNLDVCKKLLKYSIMSTVSAILIPIVLVIIRKFLLYHNGENAVGYWQAIWYISSMYLLIITTALSTYYLPKLSSLKNKIEIRSEIINSLSIIIPIMMVLSISIYSLRGVIVNLLFSKDFYPMLDLFKWQLLGDFFKITSWIFSYLMLSKTLIKKYIITELMYVTIFLCLSIVLINYYGSIGITISYAISYLIYLIAVIFTTKKHWL